MVSLKNDIIITKLFYINVTSSTILNGIWIFHEALYYWGRYSSYHLNISNFNKKTLSIVLLPVIWANGLISTKDAALISSSELGVICPFL